MEVFLRNTSTIFSKSMKDIDRKNNFYFKHNHSDYRTEKSNCNIYSFVDFFTKFKPKANFEINFGNLTIEMFKEKNNPFPCFEELGNINQLSVILDAQTNWIGITKTNNISIQ